MRISILFFVIINVANMVASAGAKYILKYSERLDKQESYLWADVDEILQIRNSLRSPTDCSVSP